MLYQHLEAGADGYQLKEVQPEQLVASIIAVHQGNANFHPKVTPALMGRTAVKKEIENPFSMLTKKRARGTSRNCEKEEATRRLQQNFILQNKL